MMENLQTSVSSKTCANCHATKPITDFTNDCHRKDGLNPYCRTCTREKNRIRYHDNLEGESDRKRRAYAANPDQFKKRNQIWRENNRQAEREQHREYYLLNQEMIRLRLSRNNAQRKSAYTFLIVGCD